ncbi:MAG: hypothetical protein AB7S26_26430 [Sandaracinaceae bacterium]
MTRGHLGWLAVWALSVWASHARAQEGPLERAEQAYQEIDFERVRELAVEALRTGTLRPEQLVRTYELLGVSNSALGDAEAARDFFVRMLWLDPDRQLDDSVSPRMREPYLEARGVRTARPGSMSIEAGIDRSAGTVHVELRDPSSLARRVRVAARLEGATEYTTAEYAAASALDAPLAGAANADRIEYYVEVLDMHGNTLLGQGSPFSPRVVGRTGAPQGGGEDGGGGGVTFFEEPLFWIIVGAVVLVGAGITVGVVLDSRSRIGVQTGVNFGF